MASKFTKSVRLGGNPASGGASGVTYTYGYTATLQSLSITGKTEYLNIEEYPIG